MNANNGNNCTKTKLDLLTRFRQLQILGRRSMIQSKKLSEKAKPSPKKHSKSKHLSLQISYLITHLLVRVAYNNQINSLTIMLTKDNISKNYYRNVFRKVMVNNNSQKKLINKNYLVNSPVIKRQVDQSRSETFF